MSRLTLKGWIQLQIINFQVRAIQIKYTTSNLNLRRGKSTSAPILLMIPKYSKIEVTDTDDEWLEVNYQGTRGYVSRDYVSKTMSPYSNLNLREAPSTTSNVLILIPKQSRIEVLATEGNWSYVVYNDEFGYVFNTYLSDDGQKPDLMKQAEFSTDMLKFVNDNDIQSPTDYLLTTDLKHRETYVFKKENDIWTQLFKWKSTIGAPRTPTISGTFSIIGRKPSFGTNRYTVKDATRFAEGYYYHSVLYDPTGSYIIDGRLGQALSHGCIRLNPSNAKWIYETIPDGTTVMIH